MKNNKIIDWLLLIILGFIIILLIWGIVMQYQNKRYNPEKEKQYGLLEGPRYLKDVKLCDGIITQERIFFIFYKIECYEQIDSFNLNKESSE